MNLRNPRWAGAATVIGAAMLAAAVVGGTATAQLAAPETTIDWAPLETEAAGDPVTFRFSGAGAATFECSVDAGSFQTCTSPASYPAPPAGPHFFEVRGVDGAGAPDPTPARHDWTVLAHPTVVAAGDIAACDQLTDEATADLVERYPDATLATLGDNVYENGTAEEFRDCYDPSWGRFKARTRPSAGNHDVAADAGAHYYAYFGAAAGEAGKGYYSYDIGAWHVVVLNSNCLLVSCAAGSDQEVWLRNDLAGNQADCTLAYWHDPFFTTGHHSPAEVTRPLFQALYEDGVELLLSGNNHHYERFAPQRPDDSPDPGHGVRQFVVGTGGRFLYAFERSDPESEARDNTSHGVLRLVLRPDGYDWTYVPAAGWTFTDSGSGPCHAAPPPPAPPQPPPPAPPPPPPPAPPPPPPPPPAVRPPAPCVVPRLTGRTLRQSRTLVARARCRLGRVSRAYSARVRSGRVVKQRPRAGIRLRRGAQIAVTVSRGRR